MDRWRAVALPHCTFCIIRQQSPLWSPAAGGIVWPAVPSPLSDECGGAEPRQRTPLAKGFARITNGTPMENHQVREMKPIFLRHYAHQVLFHFHRVFIRRPA